MKDNNILYIGIDDNNNIKIGMTQQTARKRQAGANYLIWCYAEADKSMSRQKLFACESFLREIFKKNYKQIEIDRFERADEEWLHWFIRSINCINKYCKANFSEPRPLFNLRPDVIEEYFEYDKKIQFYLENPIVEDLLFDFLLG